MKRLWTTKLLGGEDDKERLWTAKLLGGEDDEEVVNCLVSWLRAEGGGY